jgi:hypothetical protein
VCCRSVLIDAVILAVSPGSILETRLRSKWILDRTLAGLSRMTIRITNHESRRFSN